MNIQNLSHNGGHPITGDDLTFANDMNREAITGILSFLTGKTTNDIVVLSGCIFSNAGGSLSYTAGFVWVKGEIYKVSAASGLAYTGSVLEFQVNEQIDPNGTKDYENLDVVDTAKFRTGKFVGGTVGSPAGYVFDIGADAYKIEQFLLFTSNVVETWQPQNIAAGVWAGTALRYRVTRLGKLEIDGEADCTNAISSSGNRLIFTLPAGYRPPVTRDYPCAGQEGGTFDPFSYTVRVLDTGGVVLLNGANSVVKKVYFNLSINL